MARITPIQRFLDSVTLCVPKFLFWKRFVRCTKCKHDVKGDPMWVFKIYCYDYRIREYLCRKCAPSHLDACRLVAKHEKTFIDKDIVRRLEQGS
jgi:hypothetical protein